MDAVRSLDIYRKVPRDLSEATTSGALVSVITVIAAVVLFANELHGYLSIVRTSEMLIDDHQSDERLQMNLAVTLPRIPCEFLSVDSQDQMGSHDVDVFGNLYKDRLDSSGKFIERKEIEVGRFGAASGLFRHYSFGYDTAEKDKAKKMLDDEEGCQIIGFLKLNKVPGNVHISTHSHAHILGGPSYNGGGESKQLDISHKVDHLSFGVDSDVMDLKKLLSEEGLTDQDPWLEGLRAVNPLDGTSKNVTDEPPPPAKPEGEGDSNTFYMSSFANQMIYEYYMKVVPTQFVTEQNRTYDVYQHTVNSHTIRNSAMPSIYFRFDISPVAVKMQESRDSFYHFAVHVCAIVGGLVTIAGMFDAFLHGSLGRLLEKHELNKLG